MKVQQKMKIQKKMQVGEIYNVCIAGVIAFYGWYGYKHTLLSSPRQNNSFLTPFFLVWVSFLRSFSIPINTCTTPLKLQVPIMHLSLSTKVLLSIELWRQPRSLGRSFVTILSNSIKGHTIDLTIIIIVKSMGDTWQAIILGIICYYQSLFWLWASIVADHQIIN